MYSPQTSGSRVMIHHHAYHLGYCPAHFMERGSSWWWSTGFLHQVMQFLVTPLVMSWNHQAPGQWVILVKAVMKFDHTLVILHCQCVSFSLRELNRMRSCAAEGLNFQSAFAVTLLMLVCSNDINKPVCLLSDITMKDYSKCLAASTHIRSSNLLHSQIHV